MTCTPQTPQWPKVSGWARTRCCSGQPDRHHQRAFAAVRMCYDNGMAVMPCESRGEGDAIADYTVGLNCGHLREGALGHTGNRFTQIEAELGSRAEFAGAKGLRIQD